MTFFYRTARFWLLCALLWCLLAGCLHHQPVIEDHRHLLRDPSIIQGRLANGFGYILVENRLPEDRIQMHLNVFAGSVHEKENHTGAAHFLEHMLFCGTTHFKPGELIEYFQSIGMDFGADANASTGFYNTIYDLDLPDNREDTISQALLVFDDYARGALLLPEEIDRERGVILSEMRDRDSVSYRTFKETLAFELPGSILNRRFPIGLKEDVEAMDRSALKEYYDRFYRPENIVLVMVGDFDSKQVLPLIESRFEDFKPRTFFTGRPVKNTWEPHEGIKAFYHHEPEAGDTNVGIETIRHTGFVSQTPAMLKLEAVQDLADTIMNYRFSRMLRQESPPFTNAGSGSGTFLHHVQMTSVDAACPADKWKKTLQTLESTLRQALKHGFTMVEFERAKADALSDLDRRVETSDTQKSSNIARRILNRINNRKLILSPSQKREILQPFFNSLTLGDVHQALVENWGASHRLITVTGNAEIKDTRDLSPVQQILSVFSDSQARQIDPYQLSDAKKFPYLVIPKGAGETVEHKRVEDLEIDRFFFSNKTFLNIKKTDFQQNRFLFKAAFGPGRQSEPGQYPGMSYLAGSVINDSGFGQMTQDELERALAGKDVGFSFSISENRFILSGSAAKSEIETVFLLIHHFFMDPGFRQPPLRLAKKQYRESLENMLRTPDGMMKIKGEAFLAGNDSRFGMPSFDTIDTITLAAVRDWLMPWISQAPVEVSVVGDIETDQVVEAGKRLLGTLNRRNPEMENQEIQRPLPEFPQKSFLNIKLDTRIEKSMVRVVFPTSDFWDISQTRRLSVLSRIFSERLRKEVREKLGAAYSPYVYNDPSLAYDDYGLFHVVVSVDPPTAGMVVETITDIAESLHDKGVSERELDLVKKPLLSHLKEIVKTNSYWLNSVLFDAVAHPEKIEWARTFREGYDQITKPDIDRVAERYLDPDRKIYLLIEPEM